MTTLFKDPIYITRPLAPDLDKYVSLFKNVMKSKMFSNNGQYLIELEEKLKNYLHVENNAVFCNGTTALMIALKSLNLRGYVVTTPFTFPATANVLSWNNLTPIFCDIDYETMNITPEEANKYLDILHTNVSAILPTHIFGNPCDVYGFQELASLYEVNLIYDAAHAFGVEIDGKGIGTFGDISMFSFHPTKLFHTGEGGILTYGASTYAYRKLDETIKQLRNFGIKDDTIGSIRPGINGKMSEFQAIMGLCILDKLQLEREKREIIYHLYRLFLEDIPWIKLLEIEGTTQNSLQYFPIRIIGNSRDEVAERLKEHNVFARKYFYPICSDFPHLQPIESKLPIAKKVSEEILCLPFYGELTADDIEKICSIIIKK